MGAESESRKKLEHFFVSCQPDGHIVDYSHSGIADLFGLSEERLSGIGTIDKILDSFQAVKITRPGYDWNGFSERLKGMFGQVASGEETFLDDHVDVENGSPYHLHYTVLRTKNGLINLTFRDETDLTHLKRDLEALTIQLKDTIAKYILTLGTIAHDFNSRLDGITRWGSMHRDMVARGETPSETYVHEMMEGLKLLTEVNQELLELSRLEKGINIKYYKNLPLYIGIIHTIINLRKPKIDEVSARVIFDPVTLPNLESVTVTIDPIHGKTIFDNLLTNAIKYGSSDGHVPQITIGYREMDENIEIYVRNTGSCFDPVKEGSKMFQPFSRLEKYSRIEGTGLGLYKSQMLAHAMGGNLVAKSDNKSYAEFALILPKS